MRVRSSNHLTPVIEFTGAARSYWLGVFPCARAELRHWQLRAEEIIDPALRRLACQAQRSKRESLEGAIAFATFAPPAHRALVTRAITAYQVAFDYIDELSEQPGADPIANGRRLNLALLHALEPERPHLDYYAHDRRSEDTGYLRDLIDTCRTALQALPSQLAIAESVRRITTRIVAYQSLNHGDGHGSYEAFTHWARAENRCTTGLRWWETGAAAGSPLPVFALIAAAARPGTQATDAAAVECVYFPWIASLSSLLDSLIDRHEDAADGQRSLIDYYNSTAEVATRLQTLAAQAVDGAKALSDGSQHTMILAAMASFYRATPQTSSADIRIVTQRVLDAMVGDFTLPSTAVLRARRAAGGAVDALSLVRQGVRNSLRRGSSRGLLAAIRHANSGIGAFTSRAALPRSIRANAKAREVSRLPSLEEVVPSTAPRTAEAGERVFRSRA
jgi:tetraprenyl-beta-curcumene synthase